MCETPMSPVARVDAHVAGVGSGVARKDALTA